MQWSQVPEVATNLGASSGVVVSVLALVSLAITVLVLRHKGDGDIRVKLGPFEIDRRGSQADKAEPKQLPPGEDQKADQSGSQADDKPQA